MQQSDRVTGTKQVLKMVAAGKAEQVFLAQDADAFLQHKLEAACSAANVTITWVPTMKVLGEMCGITVGSATAAKLKSI